MVQSSSPGRIRVLNPQIVAKLNRLAGEDLLSTTYSELICIDITEGHARHTQRNRPWSDFEANDTYGLLRNRYAEAVSTELHVRCSATMLVGTLTS